MPFLGMTKWFSYDIILTMLNQISSKLTEIEQELKRLGWWQATPPADSAFASSEPFFQDTMTFSQWLQFVLLPNARKIIDKNGPLPKKSSVGMRAVKEFDGVAEASDLVRLLNEFDSLVVSAS